MSEPTQPAAPSTPSEAPAEPASNPVDAVSGAREAVREAEAQGAELSEADRAKIHEAYRIKFKDKELSFDPVKDRDKIIEHMQMGLGANEKFSHARKLREEAVEVLRFAQENPVEALKKLGGAEKLIQNPKAVVDLLGADVARQFAEEYLYEQLQREQNPEQYELADLRREREERLRRDKEEQAERERTEREHRLQAEVAKHQQAFEQQFVEALETVQIPRTAETVARMAKMMQSAITNGIDVTPADIARELQNQYKSEFAGLAKSFTAEQLIEYFGPEIASKIAEHNRSKLKGRVPFEKKDQDGRSGGVPKRRGKEGIPIDDFFTQARAKLGLG